MMGSTHDGAPGDGAHRVSRIRPASRHRWHTDDTARRPRPPYARELAAILDAGPPWRCWGASPDGQHLAITVAAGPSAWDIARACFVLGAPALVAPPGEDPAGYDWRVAADPRLAPVWIHGDLPEHETRRLVVAILRAGADSVITLSDGRRYLADRGRHHA